MGDLPDQLIWSLIGEKEFCAYKFFTNLGFLCKNSLNLTNLCSKQACPISNSKYATIVEKGGIFFLFKKDEKNLNRPNKMWKKIPLSRNFLKAVQQINFNLVFWPKFFLHYAKKKLVKLTQFYVRSQLKEVGKKRIFRFSRNLNSNIKNQQTKIENKLKIEKSVEHELLSRLNLGIYGKLYPHFPIQIWKNNNFQKIQIFDKKSSASNIKDFKQIINEK